MNGHITPRHAEPATSNSSESILPLVATYCLVGLILALFGQVLFQDRQFAFRDSLQVYYPLYQRVQQEWSAGRWPLWMPEASGGTPLLGNPIAAVFYPGKLVYTIMPYPWAARVYVILHVMLAFGTMIALLRSWGVSAAGAALGGLAYAFAGSILFQWANVIYLVGAAWMPLGLRAIEGWLGQKAFRSLIELGLVLSMQVLGGDLQSAYMLGAIGVAYALGRSCSRVGIIRWLLLIGVAVTFYAGQLWLANKVEMVLKDQSAAAFRTAASYGAAAHVVTVLAWGLIVATLPLRRRELAFRLLGLGAAGLLALGLSAVQLWPTLEFASLSERATQIGPLDIYGYSFKPIQCLEWLWPHFSGTLDRGNRYWIANLPRRHSEDFWVPSVYMGSLALVLACASAGFRNGPPWRRLLTALVVLGILGSLGEYGSARYWARHGAKIVSPLAATEASAGGRQSVNDPRDGDGGTYWFLTAAVPGFGLFRYPSKLLAIASLGLAGLAALGWDTLTRDGSRRVWHWTLIALLSSIVALGFLAFDKASILAYLTHQAQFAASALGPLDVPGTLFELRFALLHTAAVLCLCLGLIFLAPRRPRLAGSLALLLTTLDLMVANSRIIWTVPQSVFHERPRLLQLVEDAEEIDPAPGPFRIHRPGMWQPEDWFLRGARNRREEISQWERDTLAGHQAITLGLESTYLPGPVEIFDYALLFTPSIQAADVRVAGAAGLTPGEPFVSYPRKSFDLWNTRYFVLPARLDASSFDRGFASFLPESTPVYPEAKSFDQPASEDVRGRWQVDKDVHLVRNQRAFPRAWVVHRARFLKPITSMVPAGRSLLRHLTASDTISQSEDDGTGTDLRKMAWIETDHPDQLERFVAGDESQSRAGRDQPTGAESPAEFQSFQSEHTSPSQKDRVDRGERVTVEKIAPDRVAISVQLQDPGVVILADVYYPGWTLTIDGRESEILRVNRMMRGAAVGRGSHRLVYSYRPRSFRYGMVISASALLLVLVALASPGMSFRWIRTNPTRFR
jgi:hypothetical protein